MYGCSGITRRSSHGELGITELPAAPTRRRISLWDDSDPGTCTIERPDAVDVAGSDEGRRAGQGGVFGPAAMGSAVEGNCDTLLGVELHTARLVLRPVAVEDVAMVHAYRGCPEVVTYLTHPALDLERTRQRLARAADLWSSADRERFNLTFAVLRDGTVIGDVQAWNMAEQFQPASPDPAEVWIGYAFSPRNHGHGYATEAMKFLFDWLFARGTERVFANTYTDNTRSVAAQALEALLHPAADCLGAQTLGRLGPAMRHNRLVPHLGGKVHPVACAWARLQPGADDGLALATDPARVAPECVTVCRVNPRATLVDEAVEQRVPPLLVNSRPVVHGPQHDLTSQILIAHAPSL
jgi:RimJ/RimL family protein N-acetyltransferase